VTENIHQIARTLTAQAKRSAYPASFKKGGVEVVASPDGKVAYFVYGRKTRAMMAQAVLEHARREP
jgi:hypothetical protein